MDTPRMPSTCGHPQHCWRCSQKSCWRGKSSEQEEGIPPRFSREHPPRSLLLTHNSLLAIPCFQLEHSQFLTGNSLLTIPYSQFPTHNSLLEIPCSQFLACNSLLRIPRSEFPAGSSLLPVPGWSLHCGTINVQETLPHPRGRRSHLFRRTLSME